MSDDLVKRLRQGATWDDDIAAADRIEEADRTIAARDRRIARLVAALEDARAKGYVTQSEQEPPLVLSTALLKGDNHD
jgi:hypothetical protein